MGLQRLNQSKDESDRFCFNVNARYNTVSHNYALTPDEAI